MRSRRVAIAFVAVCVLGCSSARPAAGEQSALGTPRSSSERAPSPPPATTETAQRSTGRAPTPTDIARAGPAPRDGHCGADAILEIECGFAEQGAAGPRAAAPFTDCPSTSAAFAGYVPRLHLWRTYFAYPQLGLAFDAALTAEARRTQSAMPTACCYATCTALRVAPQPDTRASQFPSESCIAMPDAPSRFPSSAEPRCPIAAGVPGGAGFAPFVRVNPAAARSPMVASWATAECCYTIPNDTPPNAGIHPFSPR